MNNMIKIFENEEFGSLRILKEDNGRIMFCGKDVASALGYSNTKDGIRRHCRWGVKHDLPHPQSPSKTIKMIFIPEGDVYRLVAHSKLPRAAEFESWIFDKILPQINQTGGYVANEDMFIDNYLPFLDEPYQNLFRLQMMAINQLNERIRHDEPLVEFANQVAGTDDLIDMNAMAKLAADKNFNIGRTRLFRWLKRTGVLMSNNLPYQRYIDRGYFAVKESVFEVNGLKKTYRQTFVTGKGQLFIISLLRKYYGKEMS